MFFLITFFLKFHCVVTSLLCFVCYGIMNISILDDEKRLLDMKNGNLMF